MKKIYYQLFIDKEGQGLVEYGLIISLVILVVVIALQTFGIEVSILFDNINDEVSKAL